MILFFFIFVYRFNALSAVFSAHQSQKTLRETFRCCKIPAQKKKKKNFGEEAFF